jgi:hypothetical protein
MKKSIITIMSIMSLLLLTLCTPTKEEETTPDLSENKVDTPAARANSTVDEPPEEPVVSGPQNEPTKKKNNYK